ncbi:DUF4254 domain-containing protein [Kutzneria sp. NPDC052558]|uniref:DUF4254 domain-containing protein n=1 Tax=Kutzneria sp. NPDC052558 TaxID=3364121 RepID=UPI0037C990B9
MTSTNTPLAAPANDHQPSPVQDPDRAVVAAEVPRPSAIIRTCTITPVDGHRHPVLAAAAGLAAQHRQRAEARQVTSDPAADDHVLAAAARAVAAVDTGRAVLIDRIDQWAHAALPANRKAPVHTESLGGLVDRLTGAWTQWNLVKDRDDPAGVDLASALLNHVSELSIGYDDLIADLRGGRRRLPRHQNPIAPIAA